MRDGVVGCAGTGVRVLRCDGVGVVACLVRLCGCGAVASDEEDGAYCGGGGGGDDDDYDVCVL